MPPPPEPKGWWNADFRRRLAYYAFGMAIGLIMLGFFHMMRSRGVPTQLPPTPQAPAPVASPTVPAEPVGR